jgi:hypothetical protein
MAREERRVKNRVLEDPVSSSREKKPRECLGVEIALEP